MFAACAGRSGASGEGVLGTFKLAYMPLQFVYVVLKRIQAFYVCGKFAAVLGKELGAALVSRLVLGFEFYDSGNLIQRETEALELYYAFEIDQILVGKKTLPSARPAVRQQPQFPVIPYGPRSKSRKPCDFPYSVAFHTQ